MLNGEGRMRGSRFMLAMALAGATADGAMAQAPADSLPFRKGQWGAEFVALSWGVGGLAFTSPGSASVLLASIDLTEAEADEAAPSSGRLEYDVMTTNVTIGRRFYRPVRRNVVRYHTFGVTGSYLRDEQPWNEGTALTAGVIWNVGGSWHVDRHLSLGARTGASVTWQHRTRVQQAAEVTTDVLRLSAGRVDLLVNLFF